MASDAHRSVNTLGASRGILFLPNTLKILAKGSIFNHVLVKILTFGMLLIDYLASAPNISTNV